MVFSAANQQVSFKTCPIMADQTGIEGVFFSSRPKTYRALQRVVTAAAEANSNLGKKGLFGGDKHASSFEKLKHRLRDLCNAIDTDGDMIVIHADDSWAQFQQTGDHLLLIDRLLTSFKKIYPNWPDAYEYWEAFYSRAHAKGIKKY